MNSNTRREPRALPNSFIATKNEVPSIMSAMASTM
jgi:hypothetical protein